MPGDVLGTNLFNFQTNQFVLTKGPIFTQVLLADEINRTPPKTQAALLQAMQERIVTIDNKTHELGEGFMVIATQNPIEQEGTYPLPEAQLDRFLFKVVIEYPSRDQERAIVRQHGHSTAMPRIDSFGIEPVADLPLLGVVREAVSKIKLSDELIDYIVDVIRATRENPALQFGASPPRREHARHGVASVCGDSGARVRHPRRRQGARGGGVATPRRARPGRRNRRPDHPARGPTDSRAGVGTPLVSEGAQERSDERW